MLAKPVSADRHMVGTTVLTVDLENSRHRLIMLVHLCDGHVSNGQRTELNEEATGNAKSMATWRRQLRAATAYTHDRRGLKQGLLMKPCMKSLATFICLRLCPHLTSLVGKGALCSSTGKQRLQNWLVSMRSDLCLR